MPASPRQNAHGHSQRSVSKSYRLIWPSGHSSSSTDCGRSAWMRTGTRYSPPLVKFVTAAAPGVPQEVAHGHRLSQPTEHRDPAKRGLEIDHVARRFRRDLADLRHNGHVLAVPDRLTGLDVRVELAVQLADGEPGARARVEMDAVESP